jgi:hypothetical protein
MFDIRRREFITLIGGAAVARMNSRKWVTCVHGTGAGRRSKATCQGVDVAVHVLVEATSRKDFQDLRLGARQRFMPRALIHLRQAAEAS